MLSLCRKCVVSEPYNLLVSPVCYSGEISDVTISGYVDFFILS
jgi:hypothetical protein